MLRPKITKRLQIWLKKFCQYGLLTNTSIESLNSCCSWQMVVKIVLVVVTYCWSYKCYCNLIGKTLMQLHQRVTSEKLPTSNFCKKFPNFIRSSPITNRSFSSSHCQTKLFSIYLLRKEFAIQHSWRQPSVVNFFPTQ